MGLTTEIILPLFINLCRIYLYANILKTLPKTLKTMFQNVNKVCVTMCRTPPPPECHVLFEWPLTQNHGGSKL
jgi:hypothetical protein